MVAVHPDSVDSKNKFEDLSGVDITKYENPYDALIETCEDDAVSVNNLSTPSPLSCYSSDIPPF
jgi:hypothetical protein